MELINTKLPLLSMTKKQIKEEARQFVEHQRDRIAPMAVLLQAKKAEEFLKTVQEELKSDALKDAEKYPERVVEKFGAKFEKCSVYTEYDYSNCNDFVLNYRQIEFDKAKKLLDERKEFLKALKEPISILDEETGETSKIYPPVKKTTDGLKIVY